MKISTKGRYGLRLMVDLANNKSGTYIALKEIARRQDISEKYLEQIVTQLNRAGLVKSVRGAQGGYALSKNPKEITVGDVLRVVEGPFTLVDCTEDSSNCTRSIDCPTAFVWQRLKTAIEDVVDSISLYDLTQIPSKQSEFDYII